MAFCKSAFLFLVTTVISFFDFTVQKNTLGGSISFPLSLGSLVSRRSGSQQKYAAAPALPPSSNYSFDSQVKESVFPIVSIPLGVPPQMQSMILDTGSQLSWVQCIYNQTKANESAFFTSRSSSYYPFICKNTNDTMCPIHDINLGPFCNRSRCQYSYFFADGTLASGNFVRENVTFSGKKTAAVIIGCSREKDSSGASGLLGMNLGDLSFVSQLGASKFSYCVPTINNSVSSTSAFYIGENPNYTKAQLIYTPLTRFEETTSMPNFDPNAYTVPLVGIHLNKKKLNISSSVFQPDARGSGQTIIDSGTEYTYLVQSAYNEVKTRVTNLTSSSCKMTATETFEMCFQCKPGEVTNKIGDLVLEFEKGVEISFPKETTMVYNGSLSCFGILNTGTLDRAGSIIGHRLLSGRWVETNVKEGIVGFGAFENCGR